MATFSPIMAIPKGFTLVQSELFNRMRLHCEGCDAFNAPSQDFLEGRVAPKETTFKSKKRKPSQPVVSGYASKRTRHSEIEDTRPRPPLHPSGTGPSLRSDIVPQQSGTRLPKLSEQTAPLPNPEDALKETRRTLVFRRIVQNAPRGNRWRERQSKLGLKTVEEYERVIRGFLRCAHVVSNREYRKEPRGLGNGLIEIGKKLAILTRSSLENADLQRSFAYFQLLIFLSYCEFLRQKGTSDQTIDELMETIADRERDRKALLDAILWIHRLIIKLVYKGWTVHRATELFFISAVSQSDLILIRNDEIFRSIVETFSGDTFVKYDYDDCLTPSYTIPGLIAAFFDSADATHKISLIEIYDALGYKLPDLPSSVEGIFKVHPAKSTSVCPVSLEFENFTQKSFSPGVRPNQSIHYSWSSNPQPETNQSDQELPTGLQLRHQQSEKPPLYTNQHGIADTSTLEAPFLGGPAGNPRPQLQLLTQMKVPDTALSIQFAIKGNICGLKYLFSQRLASPRDISHSRGFSLVRWALYGGMCNYKTVQFLLSCGAFVDEESYQHAWDYAYRKKCTSTELFELQCITMDSLGPCKYRDWVDEQQFPLIHKIIFRRSSKLLSDELDDNPDAVRLTDAMGRTALDWATALARLSDMRLLIARGSPIDTMDVSGRTTVLHAVDSHDVDALRIILEAGANPNPEVPIGLFRSSPLTAASFGGLLGMVRLLLKFGAKVDACNPEGRTALLTVASTQNVECASILLTYGADPGYISRNGNSPLMTAIAYNSHAVLKLFLDRCDTSRLKKLQLLPIVAGSADAETMSILASSDLLTQTPPNRDGFAARRETLRSRTGL